MRARHRRVRVLIVDDHRLVRTGLKTLLGGDGYEIVAEAGNGEDALQLAGIHRPGLIIADIRLPAMSGLEFSRRAMELLPRTHVLLFSMCRDREMVREAIRIGVSGYILKEDGWRLCEALSVIMRGDRYFSPSLSDVLMDLVMSILHRQSETAGMGKMSFRYNTRAGRAIEIDDRAYETERQDGK